MMNWAELGLNVGSEYMILFRFYFLFIVFFSFFSKTHYNTLQKMTTENSLQNSRNNNSHIVHNNENNNKNSMHISNSHLIHLLEH